MILAVIRLMRPVNMCITFAAVIIAGIISTPVERMEWLTVISGALAAALITAAGNVHNDILDVEVDRINRPSRPLPRGMVNLRTAGLMAGVMAVLGVSLGVYLGVWAFVITVSAVLILYSYNRWLKMKPLVGNVVVSLLTALAFIFGALLAGNIIGGVIPAVFSLLFHFSREVVKDMEDFKGDRERMGNTFTQKYGLLNSARLSVGSLVVLIILIPLPYLASLYKISYFLICIFGVIVPLMWVIMVLLRLNLERLHTVSIVLKVGMVMGLVALLAGK